MDKLREEEAECRQELARLDSEILEGYRLIMEAGQEQLCLKGRPAELRARLAELEERERAATEVSSRLANKKNWIAERLSDLAVRKIRAELDLSQQSSSPPVSETELEAIEVEIQATWKVQHEMDQEIREDKEYRDSIAQLLASTRLDLSAAEARVSDWIGKLKSDQRLRIQGYTEVNTRLAKAVYLISVANARRWQKDWMDRLDDDVHQELKGGINCAPFSSLK